MRWLRYSLGGLLGLIIVPGAAGALYQFIGEGLDRQRYPPPGELVDVGGHRLHLHCTGAGSPTVVMDAGGGAWSLHWSTVQSEIAKFASVCSYDRAGYGWSDPGPAPRTAQQTATELHTLLANAEVPGPYVLVGHSFSEFTVRQFHSQYPNEVAGVVLVDAGHEEAWEHPEMRKARDAYVRQLPVLRVAAALGIARLSADLGMLPASMKEQLQRVPPDMRPLMRFGWTRTSYVATIEQEEAAKPETNEEMRAAGTLGDLPLVVLTANGPAKYSNMPAGVDQAQFNRDWLELQQKLARLSTRSTQVFADKSSHDMSFDQPEVVVDGVRRVLDAVRSKPQ